MKEKSRGKSNVELFEQFFYRRIAGNGCYSKIYASENNQYNSSFSTDVFRHIAI